MKGKKVQIVEVGLRDGLQNERVILSATDKIRLAQGLLEAGVSRLELGAFVREDRIPQMKSTAEVVEKIRQLFPQKFHGCSVLVPNVKGFERALEVGVKEVAIFGACSESFSKSNINCSIDESLVRFSEVLKLSHKNKIRVRGYLSVCFGCPFEGEVAVKRVVKLAQWMIDHGCFEVSIGDTIGIAHPKQVEQVFSRLLRVIPAKKLAGHFHDTRGMAMANILTAYQLGIRVFDSSLGGLGGCPYAPSATGNVATEEVLYLFEGMKAQTGMDLKKILALARTLPALIGREVPSRLARV
jgi:hydroxymethylglutaryl-CoA lyase